VGTVRVRMGTRTVLVQVWWEDDKPLTTVRTVQYSSTGSRLSSSTCGIHKA
jgi:hypothetical protein